MALGTISLDSRLFQSIGNGAYQLSTVQFGGLNNMFKISPGKVVGKNGQTSCSMTRLQEFEVTSGGIISIGRATATLQLSSTPLVPMSAVDNLILDLSNFATPEMLNRIFMGDS